MKATGIVRRIDDLGRVVIPKEIRRTMRIREGDPLEIYTDRDGEVIFKKYSPIGELGDFASQYAETLAKTSGFPVCITDKDSVIAVSGAPKKDLHDKRISGEIERVMSDKTTFMRKAGDPEKVSVVDGIDKYFAGVVVPIISEGDSIGSVVVVADESAGYMGEVETKLAQSAAGFLGRQMEE
ncbi:MAG: stage V sporulation protein T [Clostridia bacterium]|nr:stage V sporulation protein T [Clostridia bacterium]